MSSLNGGGESNFPSIDGLDTADLAVSNLTVDNLTVNADILCSAIGIGNSELVTLQGVQENIQNQINSIAATVGTGVTFYLLASGTTVNGFESNGLLEETPSAGVQQQTIYSYPASPSINTEVWAAVYTLDLSGYLTTIPKGLWKFFPYMKCSQNSIKSYYFIRTYIVDSLGNAHLLYDGSNNLVYFNDVAGTIVSHPYEYYDDQVILNTGDTLQFNFYWITPTGNTNSHVNTLYTQEGAFTCLTTPIINASTTNSGSYASLVMNQTFTGVNDFSNNFYVHIAPTTGQIQYYINGALVFAMGSFALNAPLSIAYGSGIDQVTFNIPPVFKSDLILDNGYTFFLGTPYGLANMSLYWGTIQIQDNSNLNPAFYGHFETNTIEPTYTARNASFYTTFGNSQTLTFGNSATSNALSIQFATTTFNRGITILGNITANSLIVTPTQLSFLNNVSSGKIGQSQITNGYVDLSSTQTIGGVKSYTNAQIQGTQTITTAGSSISLTGGQNIFVTSSSVNLIYIPQPSASDIGKTFYIYKTVNTSWTISVSRAIGSTQTFYADGNTGNTAYSFATSETWVKFICINSTGICWQVSNQIVTDNRNLICMTGLYCLPPNFSISSNKQSISTTVIGFASLNKTATNGGNAQNVVYGSNSAANATNNPSALSLFGVETFTTTTSIGSFNTAVGYRAGYTYQSTGTNNTLIGALTDFNAANAFNNSTALGTGAIITGSNQVVLGTTSETTILPSTKIQFGGSHLFNSVFQTINNTSIDWNTTPPTNFPRYILFSSSSATNVVLTLPQISSANVYEGMEFIFRRTNTFTGATTTAILQVSRAGTTDVIYGIGVMTTGNTVNVLGNAAYYGKIVCVNKTTSPFTWAYFPS